MSPQRHRTHATTVLLALTLAVVSGAAPAAAQWVTFTDVTAARLALSTVPDTDGEEKDVAVGDLDRDGDPDLVIVRKAPFSNVGPRPDVLLLNEAGVLVDRTAALAPGFISTPTDARDVLLLDIDDDEWLDVFVVNTFEGQPRLYRNRGNDVNGDWLGLVDETTTRLPTVGVTPLQMCAGWAADVTGDDMPDVYLSNYNDVPGQVAHDVLLVNDGAGNFTDESASRLGDRRNSAFGTSVEIHDIDQDGDNDIIKSSTLFAVPPWNARGIFILFNNGAGVFSTYQEMPSTTPYMFTIAQFDGQGLLDTYIVEDGDDYLNVTTSSSPDGPVTFEQRTLAYDRIDSFGGNVKAVDIDGDGDLDVGVADVDIDIPPCDSSREFSLLRNDGSGNLDDPFVSNLAWHDNVYDVAFLDVNGDGREDIFQARCEGYRVFVQPAGLPFGDGFESGDTFAWDATVPAP